METKNLAVVVSENSPKVFSFPTVEQANRFKAETPAPVGGMILVTRGEDGLRHVASSFLVDLYNLFSQGGTKIKKFEKKEIAIRRVYATLTEVAEEKIMENTAKKPEEGKAPKTPKTPKAPKEPKAPRGPSYHDKIRAYFKDHDTATVDEIVAVTGADERNAKVAMGIIQNAKRVHNPMTFDYHRATKTYYLLDDGFGRKGQTPVPPEPEPAPKAPKEAPAVTGQMTDADAPAPTTGEGAATGPMDEVG